MGNISNDYCGQRQAHPPHPWTEPLKVGQFTSLTVRQCGGYNGSPPKESWGDRIRRNNS